MAYYEIEGGHKLDGQVKISSSKNATLPILCASVLLNGEVLIKDCPRITDVDGMCAILGDLGVKTGFFGPHLYVDTTAINDLPPSREHCEKLRASFFLTGALLSRFKRVTMPLPGGCRIGSRPVDIHLDGFRALGATVTEGDGLVEISLEKNRGGRVRLRYPSVGATENLIMASVFCQGSVLIENAAREPEVTDLCNFINCCGGKIYGQGTSFIRIEGVQKLNNFCTYRPIPDRIEMGTFFLATLAVGGKVCLYGVNRKNISFLAKKYCNNSCKIYPNNVNIYSDIIYIKSRGEMRGFYREVCAPYPLFPTDLHPILAVLFASSRGGGRISETVFDGRFNYLYQLYKMGARFCLDGDTVTFRGTRLVGADVCAQDLRGGVALVVAGLKADGVTRVHSPHFIDRGYENFSSKLKGLGARINLLK